MASAQDYLDYQAFSRQGLIDQLSSEYGEAFPVKDAEFAVDSLDVDWNEQAAKAAQDYLDYDSFSRQGLIDQLSSKYGDQFTVEQATYGVDQTGL
ncbi:Ltp family lipoprotein [Promicromonospora sp. NPDC060204]|uniref:Ltp family lipoprotein n=1 Tax=Promicromonospora sp. NPDC060204 TaxID=3347071 RepID=UPI0036694DDD